MNSPFDIQFVEIKRVRTKSANCGLTKQSIANYRGYLQILNEKIWKGLTPHDLYSLRGISDDKLYQLVLKELGLNEKSSECQMREGLKRLHMIYNHSIHELENTFLLPIPEERKGMKWSSIRAFTDDIYSTLESPKCGYSTIVQCALFKTMYAVKNILDHHGDMTHAIQETQAVIEKIKKMPGFTVIKEKENTHDIYFTNGLSSDDPNYIEGRLNFRTKQFKSLLLKLIYNRPHFTSAIVQDVTGVRIEIDAPCSTKMGDRAIKYFAGGLFERCEMDQKGAFLSPDFEADIPRRIRKTPKEGTGELTEAKLVGSVKKSCSSGNGEAVITNDIEVQFVYTGNKNESGFNKHEIYDLKKLLSAVCRLMGSLTVGNIKLAIRETLKVLHENDKRRGGLLNPLNEKSILAHLLYSKKEHGFLMSVRMDGELRFVTKDIYVENFHSLYKDYPRPIEFDETEFQHLYKAAKVPVR
ncbi:MAG: hypothetical protein PHH70_00250 [Candidatus Gracilibacteria bacterium]|nr:hypothetical protein [Candidatus Gracilibacteria bacterium]